MDFQIEPEYRDAFSAWQKDPSPVNTGSLLRQLNPVIDQGLRVYAGNNPSPTLRSRAKQLVLSGLKTYDGSVQLKTHTLNHLKGLMRANRQQQQIVRIPERMSLQRNAIMQAQAELEDELGREPSVVELADYTALSPSRISQLLAMRGPVSEGSFLAAQEASGSDADFMPAASLPGAPKHDLWLDVLYQELSPVDQKVLEWSLGLYGRPKLRTEQIAAKLGVTPGAVSQRKAKIQAMIDETQGLSPFGPAR